MRILTVKTRNPAVIVDAPKLPDFVDAQSIEHYDGLKGLLKIWEYPFAKINLVRG